MYICGYSVLINIIWNWPYHSHISNFKQANILAADFSYVKAI